MYIPCRHTRMSSMSEEERLRGVTLGGGGKRAAGGCHYFAGHFCAQNQAPVHADMDAAAALRVQRQTLLEPLRPATPEHGLFSLCVWVLRRDLL